MSVTTSRAGRRHLAPVTDDTVTQAADAAMKSTTELTGMVAEFAANRAFAKPTLRPAARLDVEQARKFLMELDAAAASASPLLAMFWLGRLAEHAQALLEVIDVVTEMPR